MFKIPNYRPIQIYGFVCDRPEGITEKDNKYFNDTAKRLDKAVKKINNNYSVFVNVEPFVKKPQTK